MDERKPYTVHDNGVDHTYLLTEEDAKELGLKEAPKPANKQVKPRNK